MTHKRAGTAENSPRIAPDEAGGTVPPEAQPGGALRGSSAFLCVSCGRGPVRPGDRCGWCGKRAKRGGVT